MARIRRKGILNRGNNKFRDKEGWTDVTMIGDYNSSGNAGSVFPRRCSEEKCSMVNKFGKYILFEKLIYVLLK
jgi:hypothetical protein